MKFKIPPKRKAPGTMNGLEKKYAEMLERQKQNGEILFYKFESVKLKLANNTYYTPDFMIGYPDRIAFHETKGFWREDARVKIKVAARTFEEFEFVAVQWKQKTWVFEEF